MTTLRVRTGLDRVAGGDAAVNKLLRGRRVGLLAHPASVDAELRHAYDVVRSAGATVVRCFGPEHGFGGEAQDMIGVGNARLPDGTPIRSLYGARFEDLAPSADDIADLDAIVVDLADVGSRYYTFVWTAALILRAAAAVGVQTIVLDRPNPLGGAVVEGAPQREGFLSFVGLYPVSVRHGMTLGEIVTMTRARDGLSEEALHVVKMDGWKRSMSYEETGLPWVMTSPNMPTPDTARVYPGGCLIEATNLSEGRGTTRPFELVGAPYLSGAALATALAQIEPRCPGSRVRATTFRPTFQKHAGAICGGVQVHDAGARPYEFYLRLIAAARAIAPDAFGWRTETYEYVDDRPAIDLLTGGSEYRLALDSGADLEAVLTQEREGARRFEAERQSWLLYDDAER